MKNKSVYYVNQYVYRIDGTGVYFKYKFHLGTFNTKKQARKFLVDNVSQLEHTRIRKIDVWTKDEISFRSNANNEVVYKIEQSHLITEDIKL